MMKTHHLAHVAAIGMFLMCSGCSTSYRIQVVDGLPIEVYLTYPKGTKVNVGDLFVIYEVHRLQQTSDAQGHGDHSNHGGGNPSTMRMERALVEVVRIDDEERAAVRILSGEVKDGFEAARRR